MAYKTARQTTICRVFLVPAEAPVVSVVVIMLTRAGSVASVQVLQVEDVSDLGADRLPAHVVAQSELQALSASDTVAVGIGDRGSGHAHSVLSHSRSAAFVSPVTAGQRPVVVERRAVRSPVIP
jgi:hypothetical protein